MPSFLFLSILLAGLGLALYPNPTTQNPNSQLTITPDEGGNALQITPDEGGQD